MGGDGPKRRASEAFRGASAGGRRLGVSKHVAIVGCGLVGSAWALIFARAGWRVRLYDEEAAQLTAAETRIAAIARELVRHELLDDAPSVLARIKAHDECRSRVAESELPARQAWRASSMRTAARSRASSPTNSVRAAASTAWTGARTTDCTVRGQPPARWRGSTSIAAPSKRSPRDSTVRSRSSSTRSTGCTCSTAGPASCSGWTSRTGRRSWSAGPGPAATTWPSTRTTGSSCRATPTASSWRSSDPSVP